jgi:hypothetical protein
MPPPASVIAVVAGASLPTSRTASTTPHRSYVGNEALLVELHIEHTGPFQTQQGTE